MIIALALGLAAPPADRAAIQDLVPALVAEARGGPRVDDSRLEALGYRRERGPDVTIVHTHDGGRLTVRADGAPLVLEAPHPRDDLDTGALAERLYADGLGVALLVATAPRDSLDVAHAADSAYQSLHIGLLDALDRPLVVQLHGFGDGHTDAAAVVSAGLADPPPDRLAALAAALGDAVPGDAVPALAARTNVQGHATLGHGRFLHLELARATRDALLRDAERRAALAEVLAADASPRPPPPGVTWSLLQDGPAPAGARVDPPVAGARALHGGGAWLEGPAEGPWRRAEGLDQAPAWEAWLADAGRALRRGDPLPTPPWGDSLTAWSSLRAAAAPAAARAGVWVDSNQARGPSSTRRQPVYAGAWSAASGPMTVHGEAGDTVRVTLRRADGAPGPKRVSAEARWRGRVVARRSVYVGPDTAWLLDVPLLPGVDAIELHVDHDADLRVERGAHRPRVGWRTAAGEHPEAALLRGDREAAVAGFTERIDAAGPDGDLARARLLWLTADADTADALLRRPADTPAGAVALADSLLRREDLWDHPAAALRLADAERLDLDRWAAWLDRGAARRRPPGEGLRAVRDTRVPTQLPSRRDPTARWRPVWPDDAALGPPVGLTDGIGRSAQLWRAGQTATLTAPASARPDRAAVVTVVTTGPARFTLDDATYGVEAASVLRLGVRPGAVQLVVHSGEVAAAGGGGGEPHLWTRDVLAPTWTVPLPDPAVPSAYRLIGAGWVAQTTGRVERHDGGGEGPIDAAARALTVHADGPTRLHLRLTDGPEDPRREPPAFDVLLATLGDTTRRVDAGEAAARIERATALAWLSQRSLALTDLTLAAAAPDLAEAAAAARADLPGAPTAAALGPADAATAAAIGVAPDDDTLDPDALVWVPIPFADRAAGVRVIDAPPPAPPVTPARQIREALLALPWPADQGLVVRRSAVQIGADAPVDVELFCRDEGLLGRPCAVSAVDADGAATVVVADGATVRRPLRPDPRFGAQLQVLDAQRAVGVRVVGRDGAVRPPRARRAAVVVAGAASFTAAPGWVRVEPLTGTLTWRVGDREGSAAPGEPALIAIDGAPTTVRLFGRGDVVLAHGRADDAPPTPPPAPPLGAVAPWWLAIEPAPSPALPVQGPGGTWRVGLDVGRQRLGGPTEPWERADLQLEGFYRRRGFVHGQLWARGPTGAAGGAFTAGWAAARAWASLAADGAWSSGPTGAAGHGRARAEGRWDPIPAARLRADLWAGLWSPPPVARVDPRAWTGWEANNPAGGAIAASWLWRGHANLQGELGADLDTRRLVAEWLPVRAFADADWLIGSRVVWSHRATLAVADALRPAYVTRLDVGRWSPDRRRHTSAWVQISPARRMVWWEARVGVRVLLSPHRGFDDLPPDRLAFPTARAAR